MRITSVLIVEGEDTAFVTTNEFPHPFRLQNRRMRSQDNLAHRWVEIVRKLSAGLHLQAERASKSTQPKSAGADRRQKSHSFLNKLRGGR